MCVCCMGFLWLGCVLLWGLLFFQIIDLRHPENGNIIDACLHSLSEQSASITIMSPCDSFTKECCELSVEEARGKLKKSKDIVRSEINPCVNEKDDDTLRTGKLRSTVPQNICHSVVQNSTAATLRLDWLNELIDLTLQTCKPRMC